jgi:hypothetical protein
VVRALLLAGADHTIGDANGRTPREVAERYRRPRCLAMMEVSGYLSRPLAAIQSTNLRVPM